MWQRTKLNTGFSKWTEIILGVPQGSEPGPLLFNIYVNNLCFSAENTNVYSSSGDKTFYPCDLD